MTVDDVVVAGRATASVLLQAMGTLGLAGAFRRTRGRRRIAFQAYAVHLAQCYRPIIAGLRRAAPDLEIEFIALPHPHFPLRSLWSLREFAVDALGVARENVRFQWQAAWDKYDLLVCTDVFATFPLRRTRTVLVKHGAGVARRGVEPHWFRKTVFSFDLVLVSGDADRDVLLSAAPSAFPPTAIVAAGLPYIDRLDDGGEPRAGYLRRHGLDPAEPVVLLAPSWRGLLAACTKRPGYLDEIVRELLGLGVQTLVKLHACSLNPIMAGGADWAAKLAGYRRAGAGVDDDVDDVPALRHADLLVTDISSRAFNFMLLEKPVILAVPEDVFDDELDRERLRMMSHGARVVRSAGELRSLLSGGVRALAAARNGGPRLASRCFANRGHATDAVVERLLRQIDAAG